MQSSKLAKPMFKYLLIIAVLAATVIGFFIGKELYPNSLNSQPQTPTHLPSEPNNPEGPIILGTIDPCVALYLSLPPKCKTVDGKFIPAPGTSPYLLVTPEGK